MPRGNFLRATAAFVLGILIAAGTAVFWFLFVSREGAGPTALRPEAVVETVTEAVGETLRVREPGAAAAPPETTTTTVQVPRGRAETAEARTGTEAESIPARLTPGARRVLAEAPFGRGEIGRALNLVRARLRAAPVAPSRPLTGPIRVRMTNVVWTDGARRPFARAAQVDAVVDVAAAQRGDVVIRNAILSNASVLVQRPAPGAQWNYQRVLARVLGGGEGAPSGPAKPARTVRFANVSLRNTTVVVEDAGNVMRFEDIDALLASVDLSGPGLPEPQIRLARAGLTFDPAGEVGPMPVTAVDGFFVLPRDYLEFTVTRATLGTSRFSDVEGEWFLPQGTQGVTIGGRADYASLEDLQFLSPRLPPDAFGSFTFAIRPVPNQRREIRLSDADVRTDESHVLGAVTMVIGPQRFELIDVNARLEPLELASVERLLGRDIPFAGTLRGTARGTAGRIAFDLNTNLTRTGVPEAFVSHVFGTVAFVEGGLAIQRVTAELDQLPAGALRVFATGLPFTGPISGRVTLNGPPDRAPLNVDLRLTLAGGVALVAGSVDLTGAIPAYDLRGRLIGVELREVLRPSVPPVLVTSRFTLRGSGTDPNTLNAAVTMAGRFTGWQTSARDTLALTAVVRAGTLDVDTATLYAGPIRIDAGGQWRFVQPMGGALNYTLAIDDLAPVAPYLPLLRDSTARGQLSGSGRIEGTLAQMRVVGVMQGHGLDLAGYAFRTVDATHDVTLGDSIPRINLQATARDLATPQAGTFSVATLNLRLQAPIFTLEARGEGVDGGNLAIDASGNIPYAGARRVVVNRADFQLDNTRWALLRPATVDWGAGDGVRVTGLDLREADGQGRLFAEGRVFPLDRIDLRIATADLPVEMLQRIAGIEPTVTGLLWSEGTIAGPGENPRIQMAFRLDQGAIRDVAFQRFEGNISLQAQQLQLRLLAAFDTAGNLDVQARLPMRVQFSPQFQFGLLETGALDGSLVLDSLSLATFAAVIPQIQQPSGWLTGRATLTGTVSTPILDGSVTLANGAVTIPAVEQRFTDIHGLIRFTQTRAVLDSLVVRSGGTAIATGTVEFETLDNPIANVTITLDDFEAADVEDRSDAGASGTVVARGPLDELEITGEILIDDGDVPVPDVGGNPLDAQLAALEPIEIREPNQPRGAIIFAGLRVNNLELRFGEGAWFTMRNARAQLSGSLRVNKSGDDLRIAGTLEGERGTYVLEAGPILRSLEIVHAQVRFLGTQDINPALDITARRVVYDPTGSEFNVDVVVGGTLETPTLQLAAEGGGPPIPQSELLSYLLFGERSIGLTGQDLPGDVLLQETFLSGFAELATLEIERALGAPFDIFQVRLGPGSFGGIGTPRLVVGEEITPNVFLTVETGIAALFGGEQQDFNTWAARLEWRVDPRTALSIGIEPVNRGRLVRGIGIALPVTRPQQQVTVEARRRWSW